jgi:hypothetical protein
MEVEWKIQKRQEEKRAKTIPPSALSLLNVFSIFGIRRNLVPLLLFYVCCCSLDGTFFAAE